MGTHTIHEDRKEEGLPIETGSGEHASGLHVNGVEDYFYSTSMEMYGASDEPKIRDFDDFCDMIPMI